MGARILRLVVATVLLASCGQTVHLTLKTHPLTHPVRLDAVPGSKKTNGKNFIFEQTLILPDGRTITAVDPYPVSYHVYDVQIMTEGVSGADPVADSVGNHAQILTRRQVTLPFGSASLVLFWRTPPAAEVEAGTSPNGRVFDQLVILRPYPGHSDMQLAYVLRLGFSGSREAAEREILKLANGWDLPGTAIHRNRPKLEGR